MFSVSCDVTVRSRNRTMMLRTSTVAYLCFALIVLCLVLHIIVFSVPTWVYYKDSTSTTYFGLWTLCTGMIGKETCVPTTGYSSFTSQGSYWNDKLVHYRYFRDFPVLQHSKNPTISNSPYYTRCICNILLHFLPISRTIFFRRFW
jgi:hypothetical protein